MKKIWHKTKEGDYFIEVGQIWQKKQRTWWECFKDLFWFD
jgi:hypothetical protein